MNKGYLIIIVMLLVADLGFSQGNNYVQNYRKFDSLALKPPMGCAGFRFQGIQKPMNCNQEPAPAT